MKAGYSQLGAGIFASVGRYFRLRRQDQRTMVTAGAAAVIAAAFDAQLAGAFYGFELIHGSYTTRLLAPVTAAVLTSTLMTRLIAPDHPLFETTGAFALPHSVYLLFVSLGALAAGLGILTMKSATDGLDGPASGIAMCPGGSCEAFHREEPSMDQPITIVLDLAKSVFQVHGVAADGRVIVRR